MKRNIRDWTQTDGNIETLQYGRKVSTLAWEYAELGNQYKSIEEAELDINNWYTNIIDLEDYSEKKIKDALSGFGYELLLFDLDFDMEQFNVVIQQGEIFNIEESIMIICECLSEYDNY